MSPALYAEAVEKNRAVERKMPGNHWFPQTPMPEFTGFLPLAAVALLGINDHFLKVRWPGFLSGKLSDFAGCFFLPLFLSASLGLLTRWRVALRLALGALAILGLFAAIKVSPAAAAGASEILSAFGRLVGLPGSYIVADPTDLVAVPFVGLAVWYGARAGKRRLPKGTVALAGKLALLIPTFLLLSATSLKATCPPESGLVDGPLKFWASTDCGPPGPVLLRVEPDGCRATLEGGAAAGLANQGTVHWEHNHSVDLVSDELLGLTVPEGERLLTGCTLRLEGLDRMAVECRSRTHAKPAGPFREVRHCRGFLRRMRDADQVPVGPPNT